MLLKHNNLPMVEIKCSACAVIFNATIFSRAFSSDTEMICSDCGIQGYVSPYGETARYTQSRREAFLKKCDCGGKFTVVGRRYDLYRCPECHELIEEQKVLSLLGLNREDVTSRLPFDCSIVVNGEEYNYTIPGLETIGHTDDFLWDTKIDDPEFQKALSADRDFEEESARRQKMIETIQNNFSKGIFPAEIQLKAELAHFLVLRFGKVIYMLDHKTIGLPEELLSECSYWARLGSYIEDNVWGDGDEPPAEFKNISWQDYCLSGQKLRDRLQEFFGDKTTITLDIRSDKHAT